MDKKQMYIYGGVAAGAAVIAAVALKKGPTASEEYEPGQPIIIPSGGDPQATISQINEQMDRKFEMMQENAEKLNENFSQRNQVMFQTMQETNQESSAAMLRAFETAQENDRIFNENFLKTSQTANENLLKNIENSKQQGITNNPSRGDGVTSQGVSDRSSAPSVPKPTVTTFIGNDVDIASAMKTFGNSSNYKYVSTEAMDIGQRQRALSSAANPIIVGSTKAEKGVAESDAGSAGIVRIGGKDREETLKMLQKLKG